MRERNTIPATSDSIPSDASTASDFARLGITPFDCPADADTVDSAPTVVAEPLTRRRLIKGATGVAVGLAASSYTKPDLRHLGIPGALAQVSNPPPPPTDLCAGVTCPPRNACETAACDPVRGICVYTPVNCDDGNICTNSVCDAAVGCVSFQVANATPCLNDFGTCQNGICVPNPGGCRNGFVNVGGICVPQIPGFP